MRECEMNVPRIGGKSPEGAVVTAISGAGPLGVESRFLFLSEGMVTDGGGVLWGWWMLKRWSAEEKN